jgi:hypothetical protein
MLLAMMPLIVLVLLYLGVVLILALLLVQLPMADVIERVFFAAAAGAISPASVMLAAAVASWLYSYARSRPAA